MLFKGKTALITGGTRGIGAAVTRSFFFEGANVVATFIRNEEQARALEKDLGDDGSRVIIEQVDAADPEGMKGLFELAATRFGQVDILVNNAGIRRDGLFMLMPESDWHEVLRVNLYGTFLCSRLALKPMIAQRWGRIINIVSPSALLGREGQANYSASKGAIVSLTKSLAKELGRTGITVNAVSPGVIDTEMTRTLSENVRAEFKRSIPMRRMGQPEDISATILFLASEAASYLTGQVINVDGGLT